METHHCLNCGEKIDGKFCPGCGQKAATHRITVGRFIAHDLMHGVWHLEKGILFTIKEALVRPGQAALDYIAGKRIRYYNVFYLCLLLIGFQIIIVHLLSGFLPVEPYDPESLTVFEFLSKYVKFFVLGIVPLLALNSMLLFNRLRLNFAEHLIIGGVCLLGALILNLLYYISNFITTLSNSYVSGLFEILFFFSMLGFPIWTYWNLTKGRYTIPGRLWRVVAFYFLLLTEAVWIMHSLIYVLTGQTQLEFHL